MIQNYYTEESEWKYLINNAVDWDTIIPLYYPSFPTAEGFNNKQELIAFYEEILSVNGNWMATKIYPRARELDKVGAGKIVDGSVVLSEPLLQSYKEASELGVFGTCMSPEFGGMGAPITVGLFMFEQGSRACEATCTQLCFFTSIADMIERFCDHETQQRLIPQILAGQLSGSMCLTEPDAGSDVGSLRTSAEKQADGKYLITGNKIFITNGGGGLGFVLARIKGAPEGLAGISMFLVEEWIDGPNGRVHNYKIGKLEEKMGMHGSPTCEVVYENSVGMLIGKENEGFQYMLHLMNEARISVGLQSLGGIEAALENVKDYAETRKQFGKTLMELPLFKRNYDDWCAERDAFRALMVDTISYFDIFQRLDLKKRHTGELSESETALYKKVFKVTRRRTPLVKMYGAEMYGTLSQKAIQAFGGYGYMQEYDVERIHRDCFGALLYEGTTQIQSLMAMKDLIKIMTKDPGKWMQSMVMSHPLGNILSGLSTTEKDFRGHQYEFRKHVSGLILRCFKPELGFVESLTQLNKIFSVEVFQQSDKIEKLMTHAETIAWAMTTIEILSVLSKHAAKDPSREALYYAYLKLAKVRLAGIYEDWKTA